MTTLSNHPPVDHDRALTHYRGLLGRLEDEQVEHVTQMDAHDLYAGLTIRHEGTWRTIASTERVARRVRLTFEDGSTTEMPATMVARVAGRR